MRAFPIAREQIRPVRRVILGLGNVGKQYENNR
jgi:hypothetical protein